MGGVQRFISIVVLIVAFVECWRISPWVRDELLPLFDIDGSDLGLLVPLLSFIIVYILLRLIGSIVSSVFKGGAIGVINHLFGAFAGLVVGIYALGYLLTFVDYVLPAPAPDSPRLRSELYAPIRDSIVDLKAIEEYVGGRQSDAEIEKSAKPRNQSRH